jgi:hypothetical protein
MAEIHQLHNFSELLYQQIAAAGKPPNTLPILAIGENDRVFVLEAAKARVPFVLRPPRSENTFSLVGESIRSRLGRRRDIQNMIYVAVIKTLLLNNPQIIDCVKLFLTLTAPLGFSHAVRTTELYPWKDKLLRRIIKISKQPFSI